MLRQIIISVCSLSPLVSYTSAQGACTNNVIINDYSRQQTNIHSLGGYTSDDGSMAEIMALPSNQLSLRPRDASSYYYMTDFCSLGVQNANARGWGGIEFAVTIVDGSYGGTFTVNLRTGCQTQQNHYKNIVLPPDMVTVAIRIPFSEFGPGVDLTQIATLGLEALSPALNQFVFSPISFYCSGSPAPTQNPSATTVTTTPAVSTNSLQPTQVPAVPGTCSDLIIEDMFDPFRATHYMYNALAPPGQLRTNFIMSNITYNKQRMCFKRSYSYSEIFLSVNCRDIRTYEGISFPVTLPPGQSMSIRLNYGGHACTSSRAVSSQVIDFVRDLGVIANGQEQVVSIPFSRLNPQGQFVVDKIHYGNLTSDQEYKMGAIRFYCNGSPLTPVTPPVPMATKTVAPMVSPFPSASANPSPMVIEDFASPQQNALGGKRGGQYTYNSNHTITIRPHRPTHYFFTSLKGFPCSDLSSYKDGYLHLTVSIPPTQDFDIALEQYDADCGRTHVARLIAVSQVSASRYMSKNGVDIFVPLSHFNIDFVHTGDIVLRSFRNQLPITLSRVEILPSLPNGISQLPGKQDEVPIVYQCKQPNTIAFGFHELNDDIGMRILQLLRSENIKATFYVIGMGLIDTDRKLDQLYRQAVSEGHQLALNSYSDPYFSKLEEDWEIDRQLDLAQQTLRNVTGVTSTYFKAPFGDIDSRLRLRLATRNMALVQWSIRMRTLETKKSLSPIDAFKRDLSSGGSIVEAKVFDQRTLDLLQAMIHEAKAAGKNIRTVEQCLQ